VFAGAGFESAIPQSGIMSGRRTFFFIHYLQMPRTFRARLAALYFWFPGRICRMIAANGGS
jgi:hypothetical protein